MPNRAKPKLTAQAVAFLRGMDWFRGLRAAVALTVPMAVGEWTGVAAMGWAALGGFEAIVADAGGPYRSRLGSLATLSLGGAMGLFLGSIAGNHPVWALPATALFCFLWSYLAVLGQPFASAGVLVQVIYLCGLGAPAANGHEAATNSLFLIAGGAWAAVLSLLLWPLDAYRPARAAVSQCYTELASFLASVGELAARDRQSAALWHRLARHHQFRVRQAVERGWQAVAAIRARRQADTPQGHHLVVLLEHADLLIARTVALAEHMESQAGDATECGARGLAGLDELQAAELWIAARLLRRREGGQPTAGQLRERMRNLPAALEGCLCGADATSRFLMAQVSETASELDSSIESVTMLQLRRGRDAQSTRSASHFAYVYERLQELRGNWSLARVADPLRANFTRKSLLLRHAARVAVVCGAEAAVLAALRIDHGYWLLLTSLIVLQPHVSGTMRRSVERVAGTVLGGVLAAVLALVLHSQLATALALFPLALLALATLPVSYSAFCFFLTPTFVLAWLPYSGDWKLAVVRTGNTVAGAVVALVAMLFLFPSYERERAPEFLRASLRADRRYLAQLAGAWRSRSRQSRLLANARRAAGLAHNDTEESLDRLLAESWPRRRPFAQFVPAFVAYLRRFAQSVTALASLEDDWAWKQSRAVQARLDLLDRRLGWLEEQMVAANPYAFLASPWPESPAIEPTSGLDHPGERLLERMERQTVVLHRQLQTLRQQGWLPTSKARG